MKYSKDELLSMYRDLVRGRELILALQQSVMKGNIGTSFHTQLGQEAMDVGALYAMRDTDYYKPTMRSQTAAAMKYGYYPFIAELFCKKDGINKGVCFDYHMNNIEKRMIISVATLGSDYPISAGIAWALKQKGKGEVIVTTQGDGACSEGTTYETWNIAALYKLPIVFVVINNGWAMSVPLYDQSYNPNISEKAKPIGLETTIVECGNDVLAVREAMEKAIERARQNIPQVVEVKQIRWGQHFFGQKMYKRHDADELKDRMENDDCVKLLEKYLRENSILTDEYNDKLYAETRKELEEAIKKAEECEMVDAGQIFTDENVFSMPMNGGRIK
jgi:TPP-dependent pyruvate/acetoin dehydrogenase alpha subunit